MFRVYQELFVYKNESFCFITSSMSSTGDNNYYAFPLELYFNLIINKPEEAIRTSRIIGDYFQDRICKDV